jgi:hypothetical protein
MVPTLAGPPRPERKRVRMVPTLAGPPRPERKQDRMVPTPAGPPRPERKIDPRTGKQSPAAHSLDPQEAYQRQVEVNREKLDNLYVNAVTKTVNVGGRGHVPLPAASGPPRDSASARG